MISGIPSVAGVFNLTVYGTNGGATAATNLTLTLADDTPVIVSATNAIGKQGYAFNYAITATNDPAWFDAGPLPTGLTLTTRTVSFREYHWSAVLPLTINVTNLYGAATKR